MNIATATQPGAAIKDHRKRLKLTQHDLATHAGTTRRWVVAVESGHPRAELGLVLKTLDALGLREALEEEGPPSAAAEEIPAPPDIDEIVRKARTPRP